MNVAEIGLRTRPFIDMQDAYAWALHRAGRSKEALDAVTGALSLGTTNPLFEFHAGMIENSLGHPAAVRSHLQAALAMNPAFQSLHATTARETLAALTGP